jgi:hypothetical protein
MVPVQFQDPAVLHLVRRLETVNPALHDRVMAVFATVKRLHMEATWNSELRCAMRCGVAIVGC